MFCTNQFQTWVLVICVARPLVGCVNVGFVNQESWRLKTTTVLQFAGSGTKLNMTKKSRSQTKLALNCSELLLICRASQIAELSSEQGTTSAQIVHQSW